MYTQYREYCKQIGSVLHGKALETLSSGESSHLGLGLGHSDDRCTGYLRSSFNLTIQTSYQIWLFEALSVVIAKIQCVIL
jgi:hypothetical protein